MKFHSEGEFCHCHFAGKKLGTSNQMFQAKYGSENNKMLKVRYSIPPTVVAIGLLMDGISGLQTD